MAQSQTKNKSSSIAVADEGDRAQLIEHLNEDLAGELQAIAMYIQYSALLQGPYRKELRALFQAEIPDEQRHAQFLSDKIAVLGGTPTTTARPVPQANHAADMLRHVFDAEQQAIADYAERAQEAENCGELGLKVELENIVVDETNHRDEVEQILAGWNKSEFE